MRSTSSKEGREGEKERKRKREREGERQEERKSSQDPAENHMEMAWPYIC